MLLSIVIVSFNVEELLAKCLESIEKYSEGITKEVFVVDNDSSDNTVLRIKKDFPKVTLIANKKNLGFSKANNQALKKAKGDYLLVLNPDTELRADTLSEMIGFMQKNKDVAVSTCRVELADGFLDRDCRRHFPTPWRSFCHFSNLSKIFLKSKIFDQYYMGYMPDNIEQEVDACAGAFMMIRVSAIKKVGYFDEDFFFYGEDLDWCWRFREKGFRIIYTPITKIIHYKGVSSGIKDSSKKISKATKESKRRVLKESTRAMRLFYAKHYKNAYPLIVRWFVLTGVKILETVRLLKLQFDL